MKIAFPAVKLVVNQNTKVFKAGMKKVVLEGDICKCSNGNAPCPLVVTSSGRMTCGRRKVAVKTDASIANLASFGMCNTLANPAVAAATAANNGVLTPQPCVPALTGSWNGTAGKLNVGGMAAVLESSTAICSYAGNISISLTGNHNIESN